MRSVIFSAVVYCAAVFAQSSTVDQYVATLNKAGLLANIGPPGSKYSVAAVEYCAAIFAQTSTVEQYVATESPLAKAGLLANIGPSGFKSSGAAVRMLRTT